MGSLNRALGLIALGFFGYVALAALTGKVMKGQLEQRLDERAVDEVRLELAERLLGPPRASVENECRAGTIESGLAQGRDGLPPDFVALTLPTPPAFQPDGVIRGVRGSPAGPIAWARLRPALPPALAPWRAVALAFAAGLLLLLGFVAKVALQARADSREAAHLVQSLRASPPLGTRAPFVMREFEDLARELEQTAAALGEAAEQRVTLERSLQEHARLAQLGTLVMGVAHEVRNPLAAMKLRVDLLLRAAPSQTQRGDLTSIATEIDRLDRLVDELLLLGGKSGQGATTLSLAGLARARVELFAPLAAGKGIELRLDASADEPVSVRSDALTRALDNLIHNAVAASPPGATVTVRTSSAGARFMLEVQDEGPGVAPGDEARLFTPFFTTRREGVGLGLSIVRSVAALHGGAVRYSRIDGKTRFTLDARAGG